MRKLMLGIVAAVAIGGVGSASAKGTKSQDTYTGIMTQMTVNKDGSVAEIYIKLAGNTRTERIQGCGMKNADHPTLNEFFMSKKLVYLTQVNGCFHNVQLKP